MFLHHLLQRPLQVAQPVARLVQLAPCVALLEAQRLQRVRQLALAVLAREDLVQQGRADQHHAADHDGGIEVDGGEAVGQRDRDASRDQRVAGGYKYMIEQRHFWLQTD